MLYTREDDLLTLPRLFGVPDLDGDGRDELMIGAQAGGVLPARLEIYPGGTTTLWRRFPDEGGSSNVAWLGDTDGDGAGDFAFGARVLDLHGHPIFEAPWPRLGPAGDVDGDGRQDVLASDPSRVFVLRHGQCGATSFCTPSPNSAGAKARLQAGGTASLSANDTVLMVHGGTPGDPALVTGSRNSTAIPILGGGEVCVGDDTTLPGGTGLPGVALAYVRFDAQGSARVPVDLHAPPFDLDGDPLRPGESVFYQVRYRDSGASWPPFAVSDALRLQLCP